MSHWDRMYGGASQQEPESRRFGEIAARVKREISGFDERVLLLGVTPMLSTIGSDLTAVDRNHRIVQTRWIGNAPNRRAMIADWRQLPFGVASFSACIGDGSISAIRFEDVELVYKNLSRVLIRGGRFVCRVYITSDDSEAIENVANAAWRGECRSFLYFKLRLAMAIAGQQLNPSVPVRSIYDAFAASFPDRDRLADATGWDRSEIDKIDLYKPSSEVYSFPTRRQCLSIIPPAFLNARFVATGTYEFAAQCPLLVMERE